MKRTCASLALMVVFNSVHAQYRCILQGNIKNIATDHLVLTSSGKYNLTDHTDTIQVDGNGDFTFTWNLDDSTKTANLGITDKLSVRVYGVMNESIRLSVKDSVSGPAFQGKLAKANQYLLDQQKYWQKIFPAYLSRNPDFRKGEQDKTDQYYTILDSMFTDRIGYARSYFKNTGYWFEKKLAMQEKENLLYQDLNWKAYYNPNPDLSKFRYYQVRFEGPASYYYKFTDIPRFNDAELLKNDNYLQFAQSFIRSIVAWNFKRHHLAYGVGPFIDSAFAVIDRISKDNLCNGVLKAYYINDGIQHFGDYTVDDSTLNVYAKYVDQLKQLPRIKEYADIVSARFTGFLNERELSALKPGLPAPDFGMTDSLGTEITLKNLRGKLIYIDAWASWCGPCIGSIPDWNALVAKYKNDSNIVFITISLDDTRAKWLDALNKYKPGGKSFISASLKEFESEFALKYKIQGIPVNILIDRQGKIIDTRAAPPSTINLSKYL